MKKMIIIGVSIVVLISVLVGGAVVFAKTDVPANQTVAVTNADCQGIRDLQTLAKRLLWTQDEAKVASFLRQQVRDGNLTVAQARRIMNYWQTNHVKVTRPAAQTTR